MGVDRSNDASAVAERLREIPLLAGLPPEALDMLVPTVLPREAATGEVVFLEGEPCHGLHVVDDGWLKGSRIAASGREQVLRTFGPGDAINEVGLILDTTNPATLTALEPSRLWLIPRATIVQLAEQHPSFLWPMLEHLARRLVDLVAMIEGLSLMPLEARTANFLLEHEVGGVYKRHAWETQAVLASRLGTVPDVLSRVLRNLADEGLIDVDRDRIRVLDRIGLRAKTE